jgi:tetratricopeptide (TPR) repeat protein
MAVENKKLLVVDNDLGVIKSVENLLVRQNFNVMKATDWNSAMYLFNNNRFDAVIVASKLEGMPGALLVQRWRNHETEDRRVTACVVALDQTTTKEELALLEELGGVATIQKPYTLPALLSAIAKASEKRKQRIRLNEATAEIEPLLQKKNYEVAAEMARTNLEPQGEEGKFSSALVHEKAGYADRALMLLKENAEVNPSNMKYPNEAGRILLTQGRLDEAQEAYEKADRIAPHHLERLHNMAVMYLKQQQPDLGVEKFQEIMQLAVDQPEAKYEMYDQLVAHGFTKHAQEFCRDTSTPQELVRHYNNRGVVFARSGEFDQAIEEYAKAVRLIPGHKDLYKIYYNLALAHLSKKSRGDIQIAREHLRKSLELNKKYDKAQEKLDAIEKQTAAKSA